jgi:hypothetical protein
MFKLLGSLAYLQVHSYRHSKILDGLFFFLLLEPNIIASVPALSRGVSRRKPRTAHHSPGRKSTIRVQLPQQRGSNTFLRNSFMSRLQLLAVIKTKSLLASKATSNDPKATNPVRPFVFFVVHDARFPRAGR